MGRAEPAPHRTPAPPEIETLLRDVVDQAGTGADQGTGLHVAGQRADAGAHAGTHQGAAGRECQHGERNQDGKDRTAARGRRHLFPFPARRAPFVRNTPYTQGPGVFLRPEAPAAHHGHVNEIGKEFPF